MFVRGVLSFSKMIIFRVEYLPDSCCSKHSVLGAVAQVLAEGTARVASVRRGQKLSHDGHSWCHPSQVDLRQAQLSTSRHQ